jgi:hypothetical protein
VGKAELSDPAPPLQKVAPPEPVKQRRRGTVSKRCTSPIECWESAIEDEMNRPGSTIEEHNEVAVAEDGFCSW